MKIIHCADVHLDSKMSTHLSKEKAKERKTELLNTFKRMVQYAVENQVQAILIAGDLFDVRKISATASNMVKNEILSHPQIGFYYLQGNHDGGSFRESFEELPENLFLFDDKLKSYSISENISLWGLELNEENSRHFYHELALDVSKINLLMLHGQEAEYKVKDKAEIISLDALKNKGLDYLALGHIHSYSMERLDARGVYCYPGCLEGRGFDECGEHGFVELTVDEEKHKIDTRFVPIAARQLYTVPVDVTGCEDTSEMIRLVREALMEANIPERNMVKVELTGALDADSEKSVELISTQFDMDYYYFKVKDKTTYKVDYLQYERDMSLKGEFIRTVMQDEELCPQEKATVIHYGLQALSGEEIEEA